jgi:hypothetical protein
MQMVFGRIERIERSYQAIKSLLRICARAMSNEQQLKSVALSSGNVPVQVGIYDARNTVGFWNDSLHFTQICENAFHVWVISKKL